MGTHEVILIPTHVDDAGRLFLTIIELRLVGKKQIWLICSEPVVQEATEDEGGEEGERGEGGEVGEAEAGVDVGGQHGWARGCEEVQSELDGAVDGQRGGVGEEGGQEVGRAEHGCQQTQVDHHLA